MFAVVLVPNFRLQAALRFREETWLRRPAAESACGASPQRELRCPATEGSATPCSQPIVLVDANDPKSGILEINDTAAAAGVSVGQTSTQALARCPALAIVPRSPAQEQSAQAALLEIAGTLSPEVEATADGFCTVNLRTSRGHDWPALGARIVAGLAALSLGAQVGIASNPDLAFIAARHARPVLTVQTPHAFLANLALHELNPSPDLLAVLGDWGIHNLAQFTSLPRGELMDRLGPEAARLWERAGGKMERPLRLVRAAEEFAEVFDFEREVETVEPLLFIVRRFLDQLAARLGNVHRVAGRMALTLMLANGGTHAHTFTVPSPTADVDVLFRIVHTHLDGLRLDHAATGVRLLITPALAERQQFQLFESPLRDPNRFGETLGRLAALVGAENVGTAEVLDTHRPDSFRLRAPRFHEMNTANADADSFDVGLPLRRWRPPLVAEVRVVRQRPEFIVSEKVRGVIRDALGPYRASGGWWESALWATEEWDIETEAGGLYRLARAGSEWRIEGSYDEPPAQERRTVVAMHPEEGTR
jgi:protein ImuB